MALSISYCRPKGWSTLTTLTSNFQQNGRLTGGGAPSFLSLMRRRFVSSIPPETAGRLAFEKSKATPDPSHSSLETLLAHAGVDSSQHNAPMSPPLCLASTYTRPPDGPYHKGDMKYSRMGNPTRDLLEQTMGRLECHGDSRNHDDIVSCAFSSGMAAVSSLVMAHKAPVTVLLPSDLYHGVPTVLANVMSRFHVKYQKVDFTQESQLEKTLSEMDSSNDVIVWMETPSNPQCQVIDIKAVCNQVDPFRSKLNITTVVDSTLAPPCLTQPLRLGADAVMHSGTKYLGGHSDVLLGVVTLSPWTSRGQEIGSILREVQIDMGAVASPFDSWLTLRGLRTLAVRVQRQCETAMRLAQFLDNHDFVTKVHYPGLTSHPQHEIAKRQMSMGFGGILSVELENEAKAMAVAGALRLAQRATSLGGTETLVEHRHSIEPPGRVTSPPGLLRVSVGLEGAGDLIRDFGRALDISKSVTTSLLVVDKSDY